MLFRSLQGEVALRSNDGEVVRRIRFSRAARVSFGKELCRGKLPLRADPFPFWRHRVIPPAAQRVAAGDIVRQSEPAVWNCMLSVDLDNGMILEYSTFMFVLSYNLPRSDYSFAYYQHSFLPIYEATLADRIDDFWAQIGRAHV